MAIVFSPPVSVNDKPSVLASFEKEKPNDVDIQKGVTHCCVCLRPFAKKEDFPAEALREAAFQRIIGECPTASMNHIKANEEMRKKIEEEQDKEVNEGAVMSPEAKKTHSEKMKEYWVKKKSESEKQVA